MTSQQSDPTGVMIVRAHWNVTDRRFKIRLLYRSDVLVQAETINMVTRADEVCAHVKAWLSTVADRE